MSHEFYYPINSENPWILSEEDFYKQMRYLYENGFNALNSNQLMDFLFYDDELPKNPILITFDDGYLDNYLFAAPIMRQFGFTGIVFLITGNIPETTPEMTAFPTQFMSIKEISGSGDVFEFGLHTHAMHYSVDGNYLLVSENIENIRADIRKSFDLPITFAAGFAYPHGKFSDNAIAALKEEGIRFALTTQWGYVYNNTDPFLLPRFSVTTDWTHELFSDIVFGRY